eukprot:10415162-Alexandrium_andersonii.AAC.1
MQDRTRAETERTYKFGDVVDVWRAPARKDLEGWRGPAVVADPSGSGVATVKWQGVHLDVPARNICTHLPLVGFLGSGL